MSKHHILYNFTVAVLTLFLVGVAVVSGASAQDTGAFSVSLVSINNVGNSDATKWINKSLCEGNAPIQFRIDNIPADTQNLDFWIATGFGGGDANCDQEAARGGATQRCTFLEAASASTGGNKTQIVAYPDNGTPLQVQTIVGPDCGALIPLNATKYFVYVLASTGGVGNTGAIEASRVAKVALDVDFVPTAPPGEFTVTGTGYTQIPVSWTAPSDNNIAAYKIYGDNNNSACGDASPADANLTGGTPRPVILPSNVKLLLTLNNNTGTSATVSLKDFVDAGASAALGIVTVDTAGNESDLSRLQCAKATPTYGLCDKNGVDCQALSGTGCAVSGAVTSTGALGWIALPFALAALWIRRKKPL